ncbi:MAG: hypothetical protein AB7D42_03565 [Candidatus Methanomethylophilaceae archaeon]
MFTSFDPVALDRASANLTPAGRCNGKGTAEIFSCIRPESDWRSLFEHSAKMGLGNSEYKLIRVR